MKTKLLLMLLVVGLAAGVASANMLVNPSFEEGTFTGSSPTPDYWAHYYISYDAVHTWVRNAEDEAHSGSKYMKMNNWLVSNLTWSSTGWLGQDVPDVKEGKDYIFTVWAKNDGKDRTNLAAVEVEWLDCFNNWIGGDFVVIPVAEPNWIEIDFGAFTAPEGTVAGTLWLAAPVANGLNAICYDDVSMLGPDPNVTAGPDMVSWDGETVSLTGSTFIAGYSTITWSAEPAAGAVITDGDTLTPTVQVNPIIESGPATIANHSFENGLDDWDIISGDGHGTWNGIEGSDANGVKIYITPTDGRMCAYVDGVTDGVGTLSQVLVNTLAANTTYTLTVDVANDGYYEEDVEYRVQLLAGGMLLAEDNNGHALDTYGVWETSTVNHATGATPAQLGERLEIRLVAKAGTEEMTFDNVHLTADPPFGAYVPDDVFTYTLTLDIDGKYDTMKIDVYPDDCAAKLAVGREATDIVGDDCITSLADLAEMVKTWTEHNALTEPTAKEDQGPGPGSMSALDVFSLNFYFYPWTWSSTDHHTITLEEDESAGFDDWLTGGWENINVPWDDILEPEAVEITSTQGSTATFTLLNARNGWSQSDPVLTDVGNDEMMNALAFGTEDDGKGQPDFPTQIIDMTVSDIPFARTYDVIIYLAKHMAPDIGSDGTGKIVFNGGPARDITVIDGPFGGTFTEIVDSVTPGNYIVYKDVSGDSLTIQMWGNDWNHIGICGLQFRSNFSYNPSPAYGAYIEPDSELELSWTNMDPNEGVDSVYVDVWFGMDPNDYNDFNKIVDAVEDANSVTVDASTLGTYYWQVNSYIYGAEINDPNMMVEGPMWRFHAATDVPLSVYAGDDMVTWSGQAVELEPSIDDDGASKLTYTWSADPVDGIEVVFEPNEFVEDPTVTITTVPYSAVRIVNPGFEDPVLADGEWTYDLPEPWRDGYYWPSGSNNWYDDDYSAGIENPDTAYGGIVPEGENAAFQYSYYDDTYGGYDMGLRQVLATTLAPETHYELSVMVGNPDTVASPGYRIELLVGGSVVAMDTGPSPDPDTWITTPATVTYDSPSTVDVGQALEIRLVLEDDGTTDNLLNFDDVRLTVDPPFTPSMATVTLTVSVHDDVSSDEDTMKISVYDNPCLAAIIGFGEEIDPGDFDADCATDLEDYAAMAEEWLVYSGLTESIVKP